MPRSRRRGAEVRRELDAKILVSRKHWLALARSGAAPSEIAIARDDALRLGKLMEQLDADEAIELRWHLED